jgi:hypothetical protein
VKRAVIAVFVAVVGAAGVGLLATSKDSVTGSRVTCTTTVSPAQTAAAIAQVIVQAQDGATICMSSGSYPSIHVTGAAHGAYVTIRPAAGATATVAGIEVADSSYLRFQGLRMTAGFDMHDTGSGTSHNYQFVENTFEEPLYGIVLEGGSQPIKKVLIEKNYIHYVHTEKPETEGKCNTGYAQGQDVTLYYAEGVTITRNTFKEAAIHYIQGGSVGPEGVDVEHNLFEGHVIQACSHLNLWQIWDGGENDTFKDNIALGEGTGEWKPGLSKEAATDGVLFENGPGASECATKIKNSVIENNLFIDAATSYELQIYTNEGATIKNNTVIGSAYGTALLTEHCGAGSNYTMTHNIDAQDTNSGYDFHFGECTGTCTFDDNASEDVSSQAAGASRYLTGWSPAWKTTAWNPGAEAKPPAGYYIPTGLSISAGYEGGGGP